PETVQKALENFSVDRGSVRTLRVLARTRALLPRITGSYDQFDSTTDFNSEQTGEPESFLRDEDTILDQERLGVGIEWDLRDLIFNNNEVQIYGLVSLQRDIILEVSRTYFLRRQLLIQKQSNPPKDQRAADILDVRILEFTSLLDVFTDGWFSREAARRRGSVSTPPPPRPRQEARPANVTPPPRPAPRPVPEVRPSPVTPVETPPSSGDD
ncbi:MAG: hypothetical protein AAFX94_05350, partial [Myxococcota bacterium]